jgi:CHAT domain-containing protein/tetratricopeptide (TPR) repeat protein
MLSREINGLNSLVLLYLLFFFCSCENKQSITKELPKPYHTYVRLAEKYYDNHQLDSFYFYVSILKKVFPTPPHDVDSNIVGLPNTLLGFYFEDNHQPDSALYYHRMAYQDKLNYFGENHPEISKSINNQGLLFQNFASYEIAAQYFLEAISLVKDNNNYRNEYVKYTLNLANNHYLMRDYPSSLSLLNALATERGNENTGNIYLAKANNYMSLKEYKLAIQYYEMAYPLFRHHLLRKAQLANNLGNAYSNLNKERKAIFYYKKALALRDSIGNSTNNELGEIHANVASSYLKLNALALAYPHLEKAREYYQDNYPINQSAISNIEESFGLYHLKRFDVETALKYYEQSQWIHDTVLRTPIGENGNRYLTLANLYMMPPYRDTSKGRFYLNKVKHSGDDKLLLATHLLEASILINQKKQKEAKILLAKISNIATRIIFENPMNQIEINLQIASLYEKLNEIKASRYFNHKSIRLINNLSEINDIHYYRIRLQYELLEIQLLLKENNHLMASKRANARYLWIDSLQSERAVLKKDRIINELKSSVIHSFFLAKSTNKNALLQSFYYPYKKSNFPKIKRNTLFIRYSVMQDKLFIWTEINGKQDVIIRELDTSLDKSILSIRNAIREMPQAGEKSKINYKEIYKHLVQNLSGTILPEIPIETARLIIFPDHVLSVLPFEILVHPKNPNKSLIETYAISYHLITHSRSDKILSDLKQKVLAFSPDFQEDSRGYAYLKYSETEIKKISEHFPTATFLKHKASVYHFTKEAPSYRWIHIATHGDPNLHADKGGSLLFTENIGNKEPSILYADEIRQLNIGANLVVLSACQSSIGYYTPTQGMNSIAQAFLHAGASSVITSLWQVDDRSTAQFMEIFYTYLSDGFPKSKALQYTKKRMMKKLPYYWAPFILIGETGNI